jgi:hypothetical protein
MFRYSPIILYSLSKGRTVSILKGVPVFSRPTTHSGEDETVWEMQSGV